MKRIVLLAVLTFLIVSGVNAQNAVFNRVELYYAQGHYSKVYSQTGRLMNKPENDYSKVPPFYRALSIFQLAGNAKWLKKHPRALDEAVQLYQTLVSTNEGSEFVREHESELMDLKRDLSARLSDYKRGGQTKEAAQLEDIMVSLFEYIPIAEDIVKEEKKEPLKPAISYTFDASNRDEIIMYAKQQLGKPYVSAGNTPAGFDCSGFTSYVLSAYKINLPRRSQDQFDAAKKLKEKEVKKGDLVFFDSGNGVNHVGIIISEQGESPVMIHASTSKGIIITDIMSSDYWRTRVKGYGTFLH